ncbi:hypothetical protein ACFL6I_27570 [candidate division KSB1 bacterium]
MALIKHVASAGDYLSDGAKRDKRMLLIASVILIATRLFNLHPNKIAAFSIEFNADNLSHFNTMLAAWLFYSFIVFLFHSFADFKHWQVKEGYSNTVKMKSGLSLTDIRLAFLFRTVADLLIPTLIAVCAFIYFILG